MPAGAGNIANLILQCSCTVTNNKKLSVVLLQYLAAKPYTESWRQRASRQVGRLHVVKCQRRAYRGRVLAELLVSIYEMLEILFEICKIFNSRQKGSATIQIFVKNSFTVSLYIKFFVNNHNHRTISYFENHELLGKLHT
jgi:hypothetical protein